MNKCSHGISLDKRCFYCANGTEPHNVSASGSNELLCCNPFTNKKINHLLNKVNRVTSNFRHGRKVSDKDLTALCEAQLEFEKKLKEQTTPTQKDMDEKFTI